MPPETVRPNFCPNRRLADFIIGREYPKDESVVPSPSKSKENGISKKSPEIGDGTPLETAKNCPGNIPPESVFNRLIHP
ncbi:unnamed protein product [Linum trigynum]|uniref:Uncharacterized protein n=1 Tax=Linum trigynum TaxID=586398 RepID=A0AAV2G2I2_9ROSI